jgi:hypothetical protein
VPEMVLGPNFLIAGAGRSGTTALAEGLRRHPNVFVTMPKEPHYFAFHGEAPNFRGPGDDQTVNRVSVTNERAYLALYGSGQEHAARGEASVSTFHYQSAAIPEILRMAPRAKIVILLREPVQRAHSAFDYLKLRGFEPLDNLVDAVKDEDRRVAAHWHHLWHYRGMSLYHDRVKAFHNACGAANVGIWFYEDLTRDYAGTLRQVLRFIEVDESLAPADPVPFVNVSGTPRSRFAQTVVQRAAANAPLRRVTKRLTSFKVREAVRRRLVKPNEISAQAREALQPLFSEDLALLRGTVPTERQPAWLRRA